MEVDDSLPSTLPPPPIPHEPSLRDLYELVASTRASLEQRLEKFEELLHRVEGIASDVAGAKQDIRALRKAHWSTAIELEKLTKRVAALEGGEVADQLTEHLQELVKALRCLIPKGDSEPPGNT